MAHLWTEDADGAWAVLPLTSEPLDLARVPATVGSLRPRRRPAPRGGVVLRSVTLAGTGSVTWVLIAGGGAGVRVNGMSTPSGIRVLSDRDEIRIDGVGSVFFSTERLASVEPYPGGDREIHCPRCRQAVDPGAAAVRCPGCGVWHHQSPELPCWSYASTCALCPQATALDAGFRWTPEQDHVS